MVLAHAAEWGGPFAETLRRHRDELVEVAIATGQLGGKDAAEDFGKWIRSAPLILENASFNQGTPVNPYRGDPKPLDDAWNTGVLHSAGLWVGTLAIARTLRDVLGFRPEISMGVSAGIYHALAFTGRVSDSDALMALSVLRRAQTALVLDILANPSNQPEGDLVASGHFVVKDGVPIV